MTPRMERVAMPVAQAEHVPGRKAAAGARHTAVHARRASGAQSTNSSNGGLPCLRQRRSWALHKLPFAAARGHPTTPHATVGAITSSGA
jgi:hypothetical protein